MSTRTAPDVLLVTDDPGDARRIERTVEESEVAGRVHVVAGVGAARTLLRGGQRGDGSHPVDLIVLDVPGAGGADLLAEVRTDPTLAATPVVPVAASGSGTDAEGVLEMVERLCRSWSETGEPLPRTGGRP